MSCPVSVSTWMPREPPFAMPPLKSSTMVSPSTRSVPNSVLKSATVRPASTPAGFFTQSTSDLPGSIVTSAGDDGHSVDEFVTGPLSALFV